VEGPIQVVHDVIAPHNNSNNVSDNTNNNNNNDINDDFKLVDQQPTQHNDNIHHFETMQNVDNTSDNNHNNDNNDNNEGNNDAQQKQPLLQSRLATHRVTCGQCEQPIIGDYLDLENKLYHPTCVCCCQCGTLLGGEGSSKLCVVGDKWYCRRDYEAMFGALCGGCGKTIRPGSAYIRACNTIYHAECFVCSECGLELQDQYFVKDNLPVCDEHKDVDPSILLYEAIALLIRTTKSIFELNPEADRTKLVLLAKQLARSGKRFVGEDVNTDRALYEGELNAAHSNFVDFCLELLVDNKARTYLMNKKQFMCTPESFVYSARLIEKVIKFCSHV
jgi:hypothetical protein